MGDLMQRENPKN